MYSVQYTVQTKTSHDMSTLKHSDSVVLIQCDKVEKQGVQFVIVFASTSKRSSLKYVIEHVLLPTCITKLFTPQISDEWVKC